MIESLGQEGLVLIFMMGLAVVLLIAAAFSGVDKNYLRRIERAKGNMDAVGDKSGDAVNVRLSTSYSDIAALDQLIRNLLPRPELMRERLKRAAVRFSMGTFLILTPCSASPPSALPTGWLSRRCWRTS